MPKIFDRFHKRPTEPHPVGERVVVQYSKAFDENGVETVYPSGKFDRQDFINSSKDMTDIYNLLTRYTNGDETALNRVQSFYADVTSFPTSLQEAYGFIKNVNDRFYRLPKAIRDSYHNDVNEFVNEIGNLTNEQIKDKFKVKQPTVVKPAEEVIE